jgi:hypothetical protein
VSARTRSKERGSEAVPEIAQAVIAVFCRRSVWKGFRPQGEFAVQPQTERRKQSSPALSWRVSRPVLIAAALFPLMIATVAYWKMQGLIHRSDRW